MDKKLPESEVGLKFVHFSLKMDLVLTDIKLDKQFKLAQTIQTANHVFRNV